MRGQGRIVHADGDVYDGQWAKGKKNGTGTYWNGKDQSKYTGEWKDDLQEGQGKEEFQVW
jgi:hypothetical protein